VTGSVIDLVKRIPTLIQIGYLPSRDVLNQVFAGGISDQGMGGGCVWEPFQITEKGYRELTELLTTRDGRPVKVIETPDWVQDLEDFQIWIFDREFHVPWQAHKVLKDAYREARGRTAAAGDEQERTELFRLEIEAANRLNEYVEKHLRKR